MPEMTNLGHIDRALTNISVAYMQGADAFIADKVFPIVNVTKQSDVYFQYSKADMFRDEVQERGRAAESVGGNWNVKVADPYYCRKYAYHYDITQEEKVNYDKPLDVERDTVEWLAQKMLLKREIDFSDHFFKTGIWHRDVQADGTTVKKWSDQASDPVQQINNEMLHMAENTGLKPNFMIMSPDVFYALKITKQSWIALNTPRKESSLSTLSLLSLRSTRSTFLGVFTMLAHRRLRMTTLLPI